MEELLMTNPKIERVKEDIAKTKARISEYTSKLRELERHKTDLENLEIIALFRREKLSEDEFSALLNSQRKEKESDTQDAENDEVASDSYMQLDFTAVMKNGKAGIDRTGDEQSALSFMAGGIDNESEDEAYEE
jgi:hypothetical protein